MGSGIGCLEDVAATTLVLQDMERVRRGTGIVECPVLNSLPHCCATHQGYNKVSPFFVPRILVNMAAGHISIKHGFRVTSLST